jgi:hypothetical protein
VSSHSGGAKLGARIATVVSNAMVATHQKLLHTKHKLAMIVFSDISDIISEEVHETLGPILRQLHDETPDDAKSKGLVKFMATQHGQFQALAGTAAGATGLFSSISQIVNNELSPSVRGALESNPHLLPDPGTLAQLAARGLAQTGDAVSAIAQQGIDSGWGNAIVALNQQYPDASSMLELVRRGKLGRDTFLEWSLRNGVPGPVADTLLGLIDVPLSPADAALALLRGNIGEADAVKAAADWGVSSDTFNVMVGNTGEPLGLDQLLEANRRGFIDADRLVKGILQSRVRDEWIDVAEKLAYSPISVADAVNAVVQNQLSQDQGNSIATQNGLEAGWFDTLVNTAGSPLSRTEMEQLYNRGIVTKDQVEQAMRESRLKNKYNELAFELHTRLIETSELGDAVVYGSITHAQAVQKAMDQGFAQDDAEIIVSSAVNRKLETQRMAVVRAVETMYENNAVDQETATSIVGKMGFEASEAAFIFQAAEFKRQEKLVAAGIAAVRGKYIGHHIDKNSASALLDAISIPHQQRDSMLQIWQIEHDANVRTLTPAQIVKGVQGGAITQQDGLDRLMALGFTQGDSELLLSGAV